MKHNAPSIDNFLLRVGLGLLVLVIVAALAFRPWESRDPRPAKGAYLITLVDESGRLLEHRDYVWSGLKTEQERIDNLQGRYPNALHIRPMPRQVIALSRSESYFLAAGLAPVAMLVAGIFIRRREKRLLSIWKLLSHNVETDVGDLLANSDYTRTQLEQAVRTLNQRGLSFFAWRQDTDVIEDGRLNQAWLHIDRCDSCGASVGLQVPASLRTVPRCPYCQTAQSSEQLNALKFDVLRELRSQPATSSAAAATTHRPMSIGLFLVLIILCWPAAIAYAIYKSSASHRLA